MATARPAPPTSPAPEAPSAPVALNPRRWAVAVVMMVAALMDLLELNEGNSYRRIEPI